MRRLWKAAGLAAGLALLLTACTEAPEGGGPDGTTGGDAGGSTLDAVKKRGELNCGVAHDVPGFGFLGSEGGEPEGFDVDYCKAVAAAVFGDPSKVDYKSLDTETRFTALQTREVDLLVRNSTATASRDGDEALSFVTTTFYDGVKMMVKSDSGYNSLEDMDGTTICVISGTTTEQVLASTFNELGLEYEPKSYKDNELIQPAFQQGVCDGWVSDESQLAGVRSNWPDSEGGPEALKIVGDPLSKEPLGPAVRDGDSQWEQIVDWTVIATIQAEESGITSENVEEMAETSDDPEIQLLLGAGEDEENPGQTFDPGLGLETDFVVDVIKSVGNYGEIFERNVGADTPLGLERGVNALWTDGGLMYARPYR